VHWRYGIGAAAVVWVALMARLMIADVWDETNGMVYFSDPSRSMGEMALFVLTQSISFWRPLATLLAAAVLHYFPDYDVSWRILRAINMAFLLGAFALLADALARFNREVTPRERFLFTCAALFSGGAVITAGWYANIFDASALFCIACGLALLARGRSLTAGLVLGVGFFCKEVTALALPFLVVLLAARRITFRDALRAGIPAFALGLVYFVLRGRIIALGGPYDTHRFELDHLLPTVMNLGRTFWFGTVKAGPWVWLGAVFTIASVLILRRPRLIAAMTAFLGAAVFIYWGMFDVLQVDLIDASNFAGRMYLVPVTLFLFLLALERRTVAICVLLLPILYGAGLTYRDHTRFQRLYVQIYRAAPTTIHYPGKPLDDRVRGLRIGDIPDAPLTINTKRARLEPRAAR